MNIDQFIVGVLLGAVMLIGAQSLADRIDQAAQACNQPSLSDRHTIIDGQEVAYWVRDINGRYIVVYTCPGQAPEIAASLVGVSCQ